MPRPTLSRTKVGVRQIARTPDAELRDRQPAPRGRGVEAQVELEQRAAHREGHLATPPPAGPKTMQKKKEILGFQY